MKVLVVTKVEVMETAVDPAVFHEIEYGMPIVARPGQPVPPGAVPVRTEYVHGQTFRDGRGHEMTIGMTEQVAETLGMPFKVIELQGREIRDLTERERGCRKVIRRQDRALHKWGSMKLWSRLRFLFGLHPKFD